MQPLAAHEHLERRASGGRWAHGPLGFGVRHRANDRPIAARGEQEPRRLRRRREALASYATQPLRATAMGHRVACRANL